MKEVRQEVYMLKYATKRGVLSVRCIGQRRLQLVIGKFANITGKLPYGERGEVSPLAA